MSKYYVYALVDPITKLPFYIGKGQSKRALDHLKETELNTINKRKLKYINSLRELNKEPLIIILFQFQDESLAYLKEKQLIMNYGRKHIDEGGILTNFCLDERPPSAKGLKRSKDTKQKMSVARKIWHTNNPNRVTSENTRIKMSESHKGKNNNFYKKSALVVLENKYGKEKAIELWKDLHRRSAESRKGIVPSKETRDKIKSAHKGKLNVNTKYITNIVDKTVKRIPADKIQLFLSENKDWKLGRIHVRKQISKC